MTTTTTMKRMTGMRMKMNRPGARRDLLAVLKSAKEQTALLLKEARFVVEAKRCETRFRYASRGR